MQNDSLILSMRPDSFWDFGAL